LHINWFNLTAPSCHINAIFHYATGLLAPKYKIKICVWGNTVKPSSDIFGKTRQITTHEERKCFRRVSLQTSFCNYIIKLTFTLPDHCLFVFGVIAPSGPGPPHSPGFYITHDDTPQSVGTLWMSDQLIAETSTWQHSQQINIHAPGGIRTHNLRRRAATEVCLRRNGQWD